MSKRGKGKKRTRKQKIKQQRKEMRDMTYRQNNYNAYQRPECHSGQHEVLVIGKGDDAIHLYAGGRNRSGGWWKQPLAQLAMGPDETMRPLSGKGAAQDATTVPEGFTCAQHIPVYEPPLLVELDFPDFGVPRVEDLFWYALADDIREHNIKSISTQCAGGHGRTGVQLCILYYLLNDEDTQASIQDAAQLITLIRELHCSHAVETAEQQRYIARVLDIPVGDIVIIDRYSGYSQGGAGLGKAVGGGTSKSTTPTYDDYFDDVQWGDLPFDSPLPKDDDETLTDGFSMCDCCGKDTFHDSGFCEECGWNDPRTLRDSQVCFNCGVEHNICSFLPASADGDCIGCIGQSLGVKRKDDTLQCGFCKKYKPFHMMAAEFDKRLMCFHCEAEDLKKGGNQ